jgi:S-(hydroxymethyl)glutathione dehydrogenase/alcohol dehydrogenase
VRAAVLSGVGSPLVAADVELEPLRPGQVRVRIEASGVCHSDLSLQDGTLPTPFPVVPGHEGAGVVVEVGDGVTTVAPGDHVILSWVAPCRRCPACLEGQVELCEHGIDHAYTAPYAQSGGDPVWAGLGVGAFAEETVVPEAAAIPVDREFPLELAALIGCGVATGVGAVLRSAGVPPGASVAVIGCGGVGLSAVQGARLAGAWPIVAVDVVAGKLELARRCGATHVIDASGTDPVEAVRALTGGRGVAYAFEVVGRSSTITQAYAMARRGGTVTVVGAGAFDDPVTLSAMQLMADAKTVRGCVYGATDPRRDFPALVAHAQRGALDLGLLVSDRIGLAGLDDALQAMARGEVARTLLIPGR